MAEADVKAAEASLAEAKAILGKFQAEVERWDTEVKRLTTEVQRGVVDPQILLESTDQFKSSTAARDAAKATIMKAEADLLSRQAALAKAKVDVAVARADLAVAESEARRLEGLGRLPHAHRALRRRDRGPQRQHRRLRPARHGRPHGHVACPRPVARRSAAPIYVVDRIDVVRIFVDIPEQDANYVQIGTKASVLVKAYRDEPIPGTRDADLVGPQRQEPHAPRRDRPAQPRQPDPARDVRLRQGDHRAPGRPGAAAGRPHLQRRPDLLLDVRERPGGADRDRDGRQRRRVDRGHQSPGGLLDGARPAKIPGRRSTARSR